MVNKEKLVTAGLILFLVIGVLGISYYAGFFDADGEAGGNASVNTTGSGSEKGILSNLSLELKFDKSERNRLGVMTVFRNSGNTTYRNITLDMALVKGNKTVDSVSTEVGVVSPNGTRTVNRFMSTEGTGKHDLIVNLRYRNRVVIKRFVVKMK